MELQTHQEVKKINLNRIQRMQRKKKLQIVSGASNEFEMSGIASACNREKIGETEGITKEMKGRNPRIEENTDLDVDEENSNGLDLVVVSKPRSDRFKARWRE